MYNIKDSKFTEWDYENWLDYLKRNDKRRLKIDFSQEPELTAEQRKLIFPSISAFRRGENSEGKSLSAAAEQFALKRCEPLYPEVMQMFIREENFHSSYLAQYMDFHDEPSKKDIPLDGIFRRARRAGGLFAEVSVLVTAEMIALAYYSALGSVGRQINSPALTAICRQMLHDEIPHVVLQSHTLGLLGGGASSRAFRTELMEASTAAVWAAYGDLLRAGGYSYRQFRTENLGYLFQSMKIAEG